MAASSNPIPAGHEGVIPHLVCDPCGKALDFYKTALGAEEVCRVPGPDGRLMHAAMKLGGTMVFLADDFPEHCGGKASSPKALGGTPVTLHQFVRDCDAAVKRAADAGATVVMPPADMFWGDRYAVVADPFGHSWSFATHIKDVSPEELGAAMATACG
jgi:PhnB protein